MKTVTYYKDKVTGSWKSINSDKNFAYHIANFKSRGFEIREMDEETAKKHNRNIDPFIGLN